MIYIHWFLEGLGILFLVLIVATLISTYRLDCELRGKRGCHHE